MPRIKVSDLPDTGGAIDRDDFILTDSRLSPLRARAPGAARGRIAVPERVLGRSPVLASDWGESWGNAVAGVRG